MFELLATDDRVIVIDPGPEILPRCHLRMRYVDVATPDPGGFFLVVLDQRQRLPVVHDHKIMLQKSADAVFVYDLLVVFLSYAGKVDLRNLQSIMDLFRDREKIGVPWMTRHSVRKPRLFISKVIDESVSATPPP